MSELREQLAAYAHKAWSGWMVYLFSKSVRNPDGSVTIPAALAARWTRQSSTSYGSLPPDEKPSDRDEADAILAISREAIEKAAFVAGFTRGCAEGGKQ